MYGGAGAGYVLPSLVSSLPFSDRMLTCGAHSRRRVVHAAPSTPSLSLSSLSFFVAGTVLTPLAQAMTPDVDHVVGVGEMIRWLQDAYMEVVLRTPETSAAVVLQAAVHANAKGSFLNGRGVVVPDEKLPSHAADDKAAKRLWDVSEELLAKWEARLKKEGLVG